MKNLAEKNKITSESACDPRKADKLDIERNCKSDVEAERNYKSYVEADFVAPDGGWCWIIVVAAGLSTLCCAPVQQQFGLLFADRFKQIQMTTSQITAISNLHSCVKYCIGFANGPIFRILSYRQVGFGAGILIAVAILLMTISYSYVTFVLTFSLLYGMGSGFNSIANSLSLTTYFKKKRRIAYGISRTIVGIGPIIMPHIVTATLPLYGVEGCLWLYVVLAIFAALCAIFFQPSQRRAKKTEESSTSTKARNEPNCTNEPLSGQDMRYLSSRSLSVLPDINRGLSKVTLEGRPVAEANDFPSCRSSINPTPTECHGSYVGTSTAEKEWQGEVSPKLEELVANGSRIATVMSFHEYHACENGRCISANPEVILPTIGIAGEKIQPPHLWRKIVLFFDLDLLCDMSYVNLLVGITVANFAEMNFATLTPFILADWNYTKLEIASIMSMVGGVDLAARFFIPFIAGRIGWENKTFFLVGILILAMSRLYITFFQSYWCILGAFCCVGLGSGLRTVFIGLVIPSYAPLHRLPAACGLQLLSAGIFFVVMGQVVGYIRDQTNYIVTLHCLNVATFFVAICWTFEKFYRNYLELKSGPETSRNNNIIHITSTAPTLGT